jgi:hypothetical protein
MKVTSEMTEQELIEQLADAEHASWSRWMDYLFSKCSFASDGAAMIPSELAARWNRQMCTLYAELTEREKQSDRDEVAHILPIIEAYKASQHSATKYFKLSMSDAGKAMEKVWEAQTKAGLKKTKFHISGSLEVSVWTEEALGEMMLRDVLQTMKIEYKEGYEQQVKTFLDEMFGSIEKPDRL